MSISKPAKPRDEFMERVQTHERSWANENYPSRPDLIDILAAPIVVFWQSNDPKITHQTITLHQEMVDLEKWLIQAILRAHVATPDKRLVTIFQNRRKVRVKDVKIVFDVDEK
jgi:hypothetical protein